MEPDEYRLDQVMSAICSELTIETKMVSSEHFMTERDDVREFFSKKKTYLMESFYRDMRKKHNIMMQGKDPMGGQWNFDHDNRKSTKAKLLYLQSFMHQTM